MTGCAVDMREDTARRRAAEEAPGHLPGQGGAALLVLMTLLILVSTYLLASRLNQAGFARLRGHDTAQALSQAKAALIGWAVSHPDHPGLLPFPDRNGDGNYDGDSDCPPVPVSNSQLVGKLPWSGQANANPCTAPVSGLSVNLRDGSGERLWFAVSHNLIYEGGYPQINSSLAGTSSGWITVLDGNGKILTDRAAAVVIAPGTALAGQNRSGKAPGAPNYLDSLTIGSKTYSNADSDQVYIAGRESDTFNDSLLFITADELISRVETRVVREAKRCLDQFAAASTGKYPWAAVLDGGAPPDYSGDYGITFGRIPDSLGINVDDTPGNPDTAMATSWPGGCFFTTPSWDAWKEAVFYQVAPGYEPGSAAACPTCLKLNASGTFHAMVLLAGRALAGQHRSTNAEKGDAANYLEEDNSTVGDYSFAKKPPTIAFNDQVACLDGNTTCK